MAAGGLVLARSCLSRMEGVNVDGLMTVQAALGELVTDVRDHSQHRLRLDRLHDDDLLGVDEPVRFRCSGPGPFDLPPTRFVSLDCIAAVVVAIQSSPQLEYLGLEDVLALQDELTARITAAGWQPLASQPGVTGREELLLRVRDPALAQQAAWYVAAFSSGDARLMLKLRRLHRAGTFADEALYLLNLQWRDPVLQARARDIAVELRRADGLPADRTRPIEPDAYCARVRARLSH